MSNDAKKIDDILAEARKIMQREETLLFGVSDFDGVYFNFLAEQVKRSLDNRAVLVAEVQRLNAALNHEAYVSDLRARERDRAEAKARELENRIANALAT